MVRIVMISASFGSGHDAAADELSRRLRVCDARVDQHDFVDLLPIGLGRFLRAAYAGQLAAAPTSWDWMLRVLARPRWRDTAAEIVHRVAGRHTHRAVGGGADAVVSTYPLASQVLGAVLPVGYPHR
jgi:hypothetical protein